MKPATRQRLDAMMKSPDVQFDGYEPWIHAVVDLTTGQLYPARLAPKIAALGHRVRMGKLYLQSGVFDARKKPKEKIVL